jgi:transcriptional regulator with PAS, ATPase and Fis domain
MKYLPQASGSELPVLYKQEDSARINERELLYKVLFDMKRDVNDLKQLVMGLIESDNPSSVMKENKHLIQRLYKDEEEEKPMSREIIVSPVDHHLPEPIQEPEEVVESLSLRKKEEDMIRKALERHEGKRKEAARELGISERTLYRKIKEYDLE